VPHRVELFTGLATEDSVAIAQWDEYTITLDMLAPGSPFTFTIWHSAETRSAWQYLRRKVKVGDSAPDFTLSGSDGKVHRLTEYKDQQVVVLAWFPKAFTGG